MQNGKLFYLNAQNYIHLWKNSHYEINMELKLNDVNLDIPQSLCLHSSYFFTQTIALSYYAELKKIRADENIQMARRIYILEMHFYRTCNIF